MAASASVAKTNMFIFSVGLQSAVQQLFGQQTYFSSVRLCAVQLSRPHSRFAMRAAVLRRLYAGLQVLRSYAYVLLEAAAATETFTSRQLHTGTTCSCSSTGSKNIPEACEVYESCSISRSELDAWDVENHRPRPSLDEGYGERACHEPCVMP